MTYECLFALLIVAMILIAIGVMAHIFWRLLTLDDDFDDRR